VTAGADLLQSTADLVAIASVSLQEKALADHVEGELRRVGGLSVVRVGDNVIARTDHGLAQRVVLAGHLDTVPPNGNDRPRLEADTLYGLGSADMKGGLAVMIELARRIGAVTPAVDVTLAFYVGEEVAREHNGLLQIEAHDRDLLRGDAAVLGEPTGSRIEGGCQGSMKVEVVLRGARAHTARPWMGVNAIHRLAPLLDAAATFSADPRMPVIDGCTYREALQAVSVGGGVAGNVVPDEVTVVLNHRFAPDRDARGAEVALRALLAPCIDESAGDTVEVLEAQAGAPPGLSHPILSKLLDATGQPPRAKLGWTDVAFFAERGVPAVNFGPGDPELAHTAGERVTRAELDAAFAALRGLVECT